MADKKFSELDLVGSLTGTEILPVIQEGLPKRTTVADVVANYVLKSGDTMTGQLTSQIVAPSADSTYTLGTSSLYWKETYTDRLYLNSTAYLDGATAGRTNVWGDVVINGGSTTDNLTVTSATNLQTFRVINSANDAQFSVEAGAAGKGAAAYIYTKSDYSGVIGYKNGTFTWKLGNHGHTGFNIYTSGWTRALNIDASQNSTFYGSVEVSDTADGVILKSPDGTRYRLTVANGGTLTISAA